MEKKIGVKEPFDVPLGDRPILNPTPSSILGHLPSDYGMPERDDCPWLSRTLKLCGLCVMDGGHPRCIDVRACPRSKELTA